MEQLMLAGFVFGTALVVLGQVVHPHPHEATQEKLYTAPANTLTVKNTVKNDEDI